MRLHRFFAFWSLSTTALFCLPLAACNSGGGGGAQPIDPPTSDVQIAQILPADGAQNVALSSTISVVFSALVDRTTVTPATFLVSNGANQVAGAVLCTGHQAEFFPSAPLVSNGLYHVTVTTGVKDDSGAALAKDFSWTFSTKDTIPVFVLHHLPLPQQLFVPLNAKITADFSEPLNPLSVIAKNFQVQGSQGPLSGTLAVQGTNRVVFTPNGPLPVNTQFTVTVSGIEDLAGNAMLSPFLWSFKSFETIPPSIVTRTPDDGTQGVPVGSSVQVVFSEPIDPLKINSSSAAVVDFWGDPIAASVSADANILTITPMNGLFQDRPYGVVLNNTDITDLGGNVFGGSSWSFATEKVNFYSSTKVQPYMGIASPVGAADLAMRPSRGDAIAVWLLKTDIDGDGNPGNDSVSLYASSFDVQTGLWSGATPLESDDTKDAGAPKVAMEDATGHAMAVWSQRLSSDSFTRIYASSFDANTNTWSKMVAISLDDSNADSPAIVVDEVSGKYFVAWKQTTPGGPTQLYQNVFASEFDEATATWSAPVALESDPSQAVGDPNLILEPATSVVVASWVQGPTGAVPQSLYVNAMLPKSGWGVPSLAEDDDTDNVQTTSMATTPVPGEFLLAWSQKITAAGGGNNKVTAYARKLVLDQSAGTWSKTTPMNLDNSGGVNSAVSVVSDASGNAIAFWSRKLATGTTPIDLMASYLDAASSAWDLNPKILASDTKSLTGPFVAAARKNPGHFYALWTIDDSVTGELDAQLYEFLPGVGWGGLPATTTMIFDPLTKTKFAALRALEVDDTGRATALASRGDKPNVGEIWALRFPYP